MCQGRFFLFSSNKTPLVVFQGTHSVIRTCDFRRRVTFVKKHKNCTQQKGYSQALVFFFRRNLLFGFINSISLPYFCIYFSFIALCRIPFFRKLPTRAFLSFFPFFLLFASSPFLANSPNTYLSLFDIFSRFVLFLFFLSLFYLFLACVCATGVSIIFREGFACCICFFF